MESNFNCSRESFSRLTVSALKSNSIDELERSWLKNDASDQDKRNILDAVLKDQVLEISSSINEVERLVALTVSLSKADLCSAATPVVLLSDVFDIFTLADCEALFSYVERNVSIWKDELLFSACKNNLLRMCNDMLRRLSRSQNTVFRGRILLFLASFFPFSERSGLNLVSEFNLEYANDNKKDVEEPMEEEEPTADEEGMRVDYNLYHKFLTLQDFFRNPTQCYNKLRWASFALSWTDTFLTFQNIKLDEVNLKKRTPREHLEDGKGDAVFFAKYLTNPRLLQLQLRDPNFRRSLIIQGLVILQYLGSTVKSKLDSYELRPVQQDWVREQENVLYTLLAESPRGSERFRDMVKHMLAREQLWNNWKNESCPEFKRPGAFEAESEQAKPPLKRKNAGDLIRNAVANGKYFMGTKELSRLWNLNADNLSACLGESRAFVPNLEAYLAEAAAQMDPNAGIEPQYKRVNDPNFGWRALRLLAQRSPCFFSYTNKPITKLPDYIELSLKRLRREQPSAGGEEIELNKEEGEDDPKDPAPPSQLEEAKMSEEALDGVALRLGDEWLKLAAKLGYKSHSTANEMLRTWSAEDEDATPENLAYLLEGLDLLEAAEYLKAHWCKST